MTKERQEMDVKHPEVAVELSGTNANAYAIIGKVRAALRRAGVPGDEITEFSNEATSGDYDNVLITCMKWVTVE
jgi:hypothetical protein